MSAPLTLRIDLLDSLSVKELDIASHNLGEDIVHAITAPTAGRWKGLAILAYMTAKRQGDPTSKLSEYLAMDSSELIRTLARLGGDGELVDELEETEAALEAAQAAAEVDEDARMRELELAAKAAEVDKPEPRRKGKPEAAAANPTRPPRASSSRERGAPTRRASPS